MGTSVKPSFTRHRGYRTRDQPPARSARRNGCGTGQCVPHQAGRRSLAMKKPAARCAAGFGHGRLRFEWAAICRRTVHLHPPFDVAGGIPCRDTGCRVAFAHSLPQGTSAGRNLITVFSTVNNLCKSFFVPVRTQVAQAGVRMVMHDECAHACNQHAHACTSLRTSKYAASRASIHFIVCIEHDEQEWRRRASTRTGPSCRAPDARGAVGRRIASHKSVCAKSARTFSSERNRIGIVRDIARPEKRNPRRCRRGSVGASLGGWRQCSSSSSSA